MPVQKNEWLHLRRQINDLALAIRKRNPGTLVPGREPVDIRYKRENLHGLPTLAINLTIQPTGCAWAQTGGCTMCGEFSGSTLGKTVATETLLTQLQTGLARHVLETTRPVGWIRVYNEGNFTNPREIDSGGQRQLLRVVGAMPGVRRVTIEAMAKYLGEETVQWIRGAVPPEVELEVGMGFESADDFVREVCINKGETLPQYLKALHSLRLHRVRSLAYVLLKPPFLTEEEGINGCITTVASAFSMGFDAVSIEPVSIHAWSLVDLLHFIGAYEVPWLWSLLEVVRHTAHLGEVRLGGLEYYPRPGEVAHNRHEGPEGCNLQIWKSIMRFNETHALSDLHSSKCSCMADWERERGQPDSGPLPERVAAYVARAAECIDAYLSYRGSRPATETAFGVMTKEILDSM